MEKTWRRREWEDTTKAKAVYRGPQAGLWPGRLSGLSGWKCGNVEMWIWKLWAVGNWAVETVQKPVEYGVFSTKVKGPANEPAQFRGHGNGTGTFQMFPVFPAVSRVGGRACFRFT